MPHLPAGFRYEVYMSTLVLMTADGQICNEIKLDTLYQGSVPENSSNQTWNQLKSDGEDIILIHTEEGYEDRPEIVHLEDLRFDSPYAYEEQILINFIIEHRKQIGNKILEEAGLRWQSVQDYNPSPGRLEQYILSDNPLIDISYAYVSFTGKNWELRLNGANQSLMVVKWNDRDLIVNLIAHLQDPIESLEANLVLLNRRDARYRYEAITYYKKMIGNVIKEIEVEDKLIEYVDFNYRDRIHVFPSTEKAWMGKDLFLLSVCTSIDVTLELPFGQREKIMEEIVEESSRLGVDIIWAEPATRMAYHSGTELTKVFGIIVKDKEFFLANFELFFQWNPSRRVLLRQMLNLDKAERFDTNRLRRFFGTSLLNNDKSQLR